MVSVISNGALLQQAGSMVSQRRARAVSTERCSCGLAVDWCNGKTITRLIGNGGMMFQYQRSDVVDDDGNSA